MRKNFKNFSASSRPLFPLLPRFTPPPSFTHFINSRFFASCKPLSPSSPFRFPSQSSPIPQAIFSACPNSYSFSCSCYSFSFAFYSSSLNCKCCLGIRDFENVVPASPTPSSRPPLCVGVSKNKLKLCSRIGR